MYDIPSPPSNPESKFQPGPKCEPEGPVVDSNMRMDGYLCCTNCRGIIVYHFFDGWIHPKTKI